MARISVLEGRGFATRKLPRYARVRDERSGSLAPHLFHFAPKENAMPVLHNWRMMRRTMLGSDGRMYRAPILGRSFWSKVKSVAKSAGKLAVAPVTTAYTVTKSAGKATVAFAKNPSLTKAGRIFTNPTQRAFNETKSNVREAGHAVMETGRAGMIAADFLRRKAKQIIRGVASKVLLKGDFVGDGSVARVSKNAAKGVLLPLATGAVAASTTLAPVAPVVPVLVNEVIDEVYSAIAKKIKKGLSPEQAKAEIKTALESTDPDTSDKMLEVGGNLTPWLIGGGVLLAAILVMRRR